MKSIHVNKKQQSTSSNQNETSTSVGAPNSNIVTQTNQHFIRLDDELSRLRILKQQSSSIIINYDGNDNFPEYITKDNPKPAIFIVRKLFGDFVQLANKKIETILISDESNIKDSKTIFKSLERSEDPIYNQILEALGAVSEFCLPSLLRLLIAWYHHQLDVAEHIQKKQQQSSFNEANQGVVAAATDLQASPLITSPAPGNTNQQQPSSSSSTTPVNCETHHHHQQAPALLNNQLSPDCGSPGGNDTFLSNSFMLRSPTPSSPDTTIGTQISITSTFPLEYQSPSLTIVGNAANDGLLLLHHNNNNNNTNHNTSSNANTSTSTATNVSSTNNSLNEDKQITIQRLEFVKTRKLLIEYTFCQALIEIFQQLNLHPGHEDLIGQIENIAFEHFKYIEGTEHISNIDLANINQLADKYAEVIGVLAKTRFKLVRKRFMFELNELKAKEPTPFNIQCIVTLLSGIKFFRVKMAPIEDFEASFQFLQECADYFLEVRHKSIRHALAGLFVEIMVPLAAIVKNEVKIPCLKNFVDTLWAQTLDMCTRKKHSITLFPLVTCLLCLSQRSFFLTNWGSFLNMCLSNLKNRDQKMCRIALDSLYRLIWIYMIRVKCESNNVTQARLHSIVDALFPRGGRSVVPRDANLQTFVDMIQFIAQERLDFAMRHIIYDLLSVERPFKVILAPERMNIALQAFLIISENLQQKENSDNSATMPIKPTINSSNETSSSKVVTNNKRISRTHLGNNKMLSDDLAKSIGLYPYYANIQKSFNDILKALDTQYGKPLLLTISQNLNKEPDEMITSERKPKIDLFKTCLVAIPRLMPEGMTKPELIDLLSRMTVHIDEEMRKFSFESLQILTTDFPDWRLDVIEGYTLFITNQLVNHESLRHLLDNALKMLLQLLISWKAAIRLNTTTSGTTSNNLQSASSNCCYVDSAAASSSMRDNRAGSIVSIQTGYETISSRHSGTGGQIAARKNRALAEMRLIQSELNSIRFDRLISVIQKVESNSLQMLCNFNQPTRKLATHLLRESRTILKCYSSWVCMEQFGFKSPEDDEEDDLSASLRGSLSADNLSRITTTSLGNPSMYYGHHHSSVTSMNTSSNNNNNQANLMNTSVSKMCISSNNNSNNQQQNNANNHHQHQHDPYDSDIEQNLVDCFSNEDDNSCIIFWLAIIMLESELDQEYTMALNLLKKILPNLPFEQQAFVEELERQLEQMNWSNFPGIHKLLMRGCTKSAKTYEISIALLDQLTPILKLQIVCSNTSNNNKQQVLPSFDDDKFPLHVIILLTYLLTNYDDPTSFCLNIARRIAIWCDENGSGKLDNLATVMNLYSRRSFSKDAFQWTKCVVKYLYDAYNHSLPKTIPILVDLLENGPHQVQRLIGPILYCILNYVDIGSTQVLDLIDLTRIYQKYLLEGTHEWRVAIQIFKLIISRSSYLATKSSSHSLRELPGRTMDFSIEIESLPVIAKSRLNELAADLLAQHSSSSSNQATTSVVTSPPPPSSNTLTTTTTTTATTLEQQVTQELDNILLDSLQQQEQQSSLTQQQQQQDLSSSSLLSKQQHLLVSVNNNNQEDESADDNQQQQQQQQQLSAAVELNKWRKSWLSQNHIRQRLISLLTN